MTRLHLQYVQSYRGYHYFRRRGSPYVQLPGVVGSAEFMEAYQRALAAAPVAIGASKRSQPGSFSAAIAEYYGSPAFRSLTGGTPARYRAVLRARGLAEGPSAISSVGVARPLPKVACDRSPRGSAMWRHGVDEHEGVVTEASP
jgi:hypothetical protein